MLPGLLGQDVSPQEMNSQERKEYFMQQFIQKTIREHKRIVATGVMLAVVTTAFAAAKSVATTPADSMRREAPVAAATELSSAFRDVSNRLLPSVVTIESRPAADEMAKSTPRPSQPGEEANPFEGTPFGDLFRNGPFGKGFRFENPPSEPHHRGGGSGSGVIIDSDGLILTNNHVVSGGGKVIVRLSDGREYEAAEVRTDPKTDLAIVRIEGASPLVAATLGDSDQVEVGDWVLALGQPFGLESTVTAGIISAKHRGIGITARENFLQTDAAINPGNSGGPLVNLHGEVIGINTAISSRGGGNDGIGFAVPANMARWVADQLTTDGVVRRAYLGVGIQPVTATLAEQFHVKPREGVVVTEVRPDTPAAAAGLQAGDVIVEFAGMPISDAGQLQTAVERAAIGSSQELTVIRDGKRMSLTLEPEEQPADLASSTPGEAAPRGTASFEQFGMQVGELSADVARELGVAGAHGVVITEVEPGSAAEEAGLEAGNVITKVNGKDVSSVAEVADLLSAEANGDGNGVLLLVRTSAGSRFVVVG
ncbi:MAG: trypsin-like peptidase domain-containing protein [Planctomycetales bacterium]|nr:trypsin-like peptidase domain-containing protein [Planctomycetales bacterium]